MSQGTAKELERNEAYGFDLLENGKLLLFTWYPIAGLSISLFKKGITDFAERCKTRRPVYAVIDASRLDQKSPAVAWLRSQAVSEDGEDYNSWWTREIVPLYREAGIASLAVATGDPRAPGELPELFPGISFKVGYFPDLQSSLAWRPE